jgi:transposase
VGHSGANCISDAGWYSLLLKIAYKAELAAFHQVRLLRKHFEDVLVLRPQGCRAAAGWTRLDVPEHDRDVNAARIILRLGIPELRASGSHVPCLWRPA